MEIFKKRLMMLASVMGLIVVFSMISCVNSDDPFLQKLIAGEKIGVWIITSYLFFSLALILFEEISISSVNILLSSFVLIAGFVIELIKLAEIRSFLPQETFFHSYLLLIFLNSISIGILLWLSKDPFREVAGKVKGFLGK